MLAKQKGITIPFDEGMADFSGMVKNEDEHHLWIAKARHEAGIEVAKEGIEAAAYTVIQMAVEDTSVNDYEYLDLTLDRPFLYAIVHENGLPLFVGNLSSLS